MKSTLFAAAALVVLGLSAPVSAAPAAMVKDLAAAAPASAVEAINHRGATCQLGQRGWHYHNRFGDRIVCSPRPRGVFYTWRNEGSRYGWYHRGYRRWY
jgi:hypothetical protein